MTQLKLVYVVYTLKDTTTLGTLNKLVICNKLLLHTNNILGSPRLMPRRALNSMMDAP